jgi:hypothetical protein
VANDTPIRNAMLDELHQPLVVDGVEKSTNVRIEYPVHFALGDTDCQGIQCLVCSTLRPKAIRESLEVFFVHRL